MSDNFSQHIVEVDHAKVHVIAAGEEHRLTVVLLHGWPQDATAWRRVMRLASKEVRCIAVDLPGVSGSTPTNGEKSAMAARIHSAIVKLGGGKHVIVGHDIGAMVAFDYLRQFASDLHAAVLMDAAIPGVQPWEKVIANPHIWHFAFHAIPQLPEALVAGKQEKYFDYFFHALSKDNAAITKAARRHYNAAYAGDALQAGFDWYRAFAKDAKQNQPRHKIQPPLLYIRGDAEQGAMDDYVAGFHAAGAQQVDTALIPQAGHFTPEENPEQVWRAISKLLSDARVVTK